MNMIRDEGSERADLLARSNLPIPVMKYADQVDIRPAYRLLISLQISACLAVMTTLRSFVLPSQVYEPTCGDSNVSEASAWSHPRIDRVDTVDCRHGKTYGLEYCEAKALSFQNYHKTSIITHVFLTSMT